MNESLIGLGKKLEECNLCDLRKNCISPVGWYGNIESPLFIAGEGPGRQEDEYGCPLIGKSGQLLDRALWSVGITRDRVITSNIVKCRPLNNRTPSLKEGVFCSAQWLDKEIELIRPAVIIAIGSMALHYFGNDKMRITKERGKWFETKYGIPCITTYHPAYLLRLYGEQLKKAKWEMYYDLKSAVDKCKEINPDYVFASSEMTDLFSLFPKRI